MKPSHPAAATGRPRVLLVGLLSGMGGMHLPRHLARNGMELSFIGTPKCMASRSGHIRTRFSWEQKPGGFDFGPLLSCVQKLDPDWIIPIDELSTLRLQDIGHGTLAGTGTPFPEKSVRLVRRSLGEPSGYARASTRKFFHSTAQQAGIPTPKQIDVSGIDALRAFADQHGYPVVLKRELSMGGAGVFFAADENALLTLWEKHGTASANSAWIAQEFVPGSLGIHAVFSSGGQVLAQISARQLCQRSSRTSAPSSVVRLCRHAQMAADAAAFVAQTGASGFHGWDFQLKDTGEALMIEHNPRPISISHLGGLIGSDLCASLAATCGMSPSSTAGPAEESDVCFFPDEWWRDPLSPLLHDAFHDAPWDDPALLRAIVQSPRRFV